MIDVCLNFALICREIPNITERKDKYSLNVSAMYIKDSSRRETFDSHGVDTSDLSGENLFVDSGRTARFLEAKECVSSLFLTDSYGDNFVSMMQIVANDVCFIMIMAVMTSSSCGSCAPYNHHFHGSGGAMGGDGDKYLQLR